MAKKPKTSIGVIFWIALLLFLALLYVANRVNFNKIVGESGISDVVRNRFGGDYRDPKDPAIPVVTPPPSQAPAPVPPVVTNKNPVQSQEQTPRTEPVRQENQTPPKTPQGTIPNTQQNVPPNTQQNTSPKAEPKAEIKPESKPPLKRVPEETMKTRVSKLFYVRLTEDSHIVRIQVERKVDFETGPMTETLKALLRGPSEEEKKKGIVSLIPDKTRLISVAVKDGIAVVDFSESFRFNSYGVEGYRGQVEQIIYTATEFPGVSAVQILIEGSKLDYLSPEGIFIGKPLKRDGL